MFNIVVLTGRLTADAEIKKTTNDVSVTSFTIAVDRPHKSGEEKKTDFINVVAWRQTAEFISHYFRKGSMIGIEGSLQSRKYQDKDGKNHTVFEVVANNAQFVSPKPTENNNNVSGESDLPNTKNATGTNFGNDNNGFVETYTEDLPF